jgi:hypothetical protein
LASTTEAAVASWHPTSWSAGEKAVASSAYRFSAPTPWSEATRGSDSVLWMPWSRHAWLKAGYAAGPVDGDVVDAHDPLLPPGVEARTTALVVLRLVDLRRLLVGEDRRRDPLRVVEQRDPDEGGGRDGADGQLRHPGQGVLEGRVGYEEPGQHLHRLCCDLLRHDDPRMRCRRALSLKVTATHRTLVPTTHRRSPGRSTAPGR